jgi:hypothetical protein
MTEIIILEKCPECRRFSFDGLRGVCLICGYEVVMKES